MVARQCVHIVDNYHTFVLTPRSPYAWRATLMCRLDEQVSSRQGGSCTLLCAILKGHTSLFLESKRLKYGPL